MASPSAANALVRLDERPSPDTPADETGRPLRRLRRWLVWLVFVVPVTVAVFYNFVIATPRYASEIAFVVRSSETPHDRLSIVSLGQGGGIGTSDDSEAVVAYLKSRDVLGSVNRDGLVTRTFARRGLDPVAAFPSLLAGTSDEDFYRHFQAYVHSDFDRATDIIHVQVQSFAAADAQEIARRLLGASEAMVNRLNRRAQTNMVGGAERDVAQASDQLKRVLAEMNDVRNRNHIIEPELDTGASVKLQSGTAAELAQIEVQLDQTLRVAPRSPLIGQLRARRSALESQLDRQIGATAGGSGSLADRLRGYEELAARRDIAEKQLMGASLQLISAHDSASRQQLYLEEISRPNLSDEARYPRRWLNLLLTLLVSGGLLWIALSLAELVFDDE
jgi:BexC/CtrB/KpsE family polysaccharide export inner-membrane protein